LVLLLATTLGGAFVAWRQYGELVELRAITMNRNERANLQKRVWALEKLNRELQDRLAAGRSMGNAETSRLATAEDGRTPRDPNARGGRGDPRGRGESGMQQMSALRDLMAKPEVQAMINLQQKAGIEARYATLFKNLNLSSDQSAKLTSLLAERGNRGSIRGPTPRPSASCFPMLKTSSTPASSPSSATAVSPSSKPTNKRFPSETWSTSSNSA
jgi:hypothetical protein